MTDSTDFFAFLVLAIFTVCGVVGVVTLLSGVDVNSTSLMRQCKEQGYYNIGQHTIECKIVDKKVEK